MHDIVNISGIVGYPGVISDLNVCDQIYRHDDSPLRLMSYSINRVEVDFCKGQYTG
jgi:hypothetical protein